MATGTQKLRPQAKMTQISTARVSNTRQKASQSQELGMRKIALGTKMSLAHQAHSSAPFLYSHTYPTSRIPRNTNIEISANSPMCATTQLRYNIAHGIRNIVSTSNTTNSMAMM